MNDEKQNSRTEGFILHPSSFILSAPRGPRLWTLDFRLWTCLTALCLFAFRAGAQLTVDVVITNGLFEPYGVAADPDNIIYITDSANHRIVRHDPNTGVSTTVAGIPGESGNNDGPFYLAHFNSPEGITLATVGGANGLVVADTGNHLIRFV